MPTRETASAITVKRQGEYWRENDGGYTGKVELGTRKKFLAVGKACKAIF